MKINKLENSNFAVFAMALIVGGLASLWRVTRQPWLPCSGRSCVPTAICAPCTSERVGVGECDEKGGLSTVRASKG